MDFVCEKNKCTGCKACLDSCKFNALEFHDDEQYCFVTIDESKCINCNSCKKVCQVNYPVILNKPILWKQGWGEEKNRITSSSGGLATQIMQQFVSDKSFVCSCYFNKGDFKYYITNKRDEIELFKGSKYVKSNPQNVYRKIKDILEDGNKILIIGLPCHIAAVKRFLGDRYKNDLYTIDLICHGTPSIKILSHFFKGYGIDINDINNISFRTNNHYAISINSNNDISCGAIDSYTLGFLRGLFYTENCYNCRYAQIDRVGDLTLGDSWGTELKTQEKYGVSLVLCQTEKGKELLFGSNLILCDVDIKKAVSANHQLQHPAILPQERDKFFSQYKKKKNVKRSIFICYPKDCIKQKIKSILLKYKIIHL